MNLKLIGLMSCSVFTLGACSFTPPEQATGTFEYVEAKPAAKLEPAPELGLKADERSYAIPEQNSQGKLGAQVNIQPPTLIRAVAAGSRTEEAEDQVRVYFDELENMDNLPEFVWSALVAGMAQQQIAVVDSAEQQQLTTDWVTESTTLGADELELTVQRKFQISMDTATHGRTTAVKVDVIERQASGPGAAIEWPVLSDRNAAATLLNQLVTEVAITQVTEQVLAPSSSNLEAAAGFNSDGFPALVVDSSFTTVWALMGQVLPALGFEIDDLNQSTGQYFTTYNEESSGFNWAFWRDQNAGKLPLVAGEYMIRVTGDRQSTTITLHYNDQPLSAEDLTRIFAPFAAEIRKQSSL